MAVLKGRDARELFQKFGAEAGALKVCELLIEELVGHRQAVREMAQQQTRMIELLSVVTAGTAQLKSELDGVKRNQDVYENMEKPN